MVSSGSQVRATWPLVMISEDIDGEQGAHHTLLVHIREALAGIPLTGPAALDVRRKGTTDAWPQPLRPGGQTAFHIHPGGTMTIGATYGRPMMILLGHPG